MAFSYEQKLNRKKAELHALADNYAGTMERYAKTHAEWVDRTGHTRQSIHSGVEVNGDEVTTYLSHGSEAGNYLEEGTGIHGPKGVPYKIKPKNKQALFWYGASHPVREVIHPGIKAQPIIGPTVDVHWNKMRDSVHRLFRRD
ncbi:hypothetical protein [Halobacillus litoralis]|uniref:HK97 gp10 family phage protein n=1 Tax=Halobacillus litoralis TaxID=45668 RepID=A0A410MCF5_9BACI|nr:hypothetical protein [Halobacillus litoralis]QAS52380.1 hypothetical protein HLI_09110 [Halobacillus litoralis]